jgi:hypothetical protein
MSLPSSGEFASARSVEIHPELRSGALDCPDLALKAAGTGTDVEEDSPGTPNPHRGTAGENSTD